MIPNPCFRIDGFAHGAEQSQRRQIVFLHPLIAPANECADRGRRGVENVDLVLLDDSPEPIRFRPVRSAFIHERCRAVRERTVNDITVSRDPADVGRAPKNIVVAKIENIFGRRINSDQIAAGRMQNSFRFPGRAAGVENVKRMFAVDWRRRTVVIHIFELAVPPNVAPFFHVDLVMRALKNDHPFDRCPDAKRVIDVLFQGNDSATTKTPVRSDERDRAAVMDTITN